MLLAATVGLLAGCKRDLLDKKPLDGFDENTIWNDKSLADGFVLSTYSTVVGGLYYNQQTDDMTDNSCNNYSNGVTLENIDNTYDAGWNQYARIRRCNLILEKMAASKTIDEPSKKIMIGEAKFLRALIYYYMAQRFGGLMIVDKVYDQNQADFQFPRKTIEETYDFILKDLADAAANLPATAATGRATKGAALAFITRVGLQGAAYAPSRKAQYLDQAKSAAEQVFTLGYSLDADYGGMFNDFSKGLGSKEIIFGYYRRSTNTQFQSTPMQSLTPNTGNEKISVGYGPAFVESFEGWPDRFPSQNLVDAFEVIDDNAGGVATKWNQSSYYLSWQATGGFVSELLYKHRDKRFAVSIVYDSTKLFNNLVTTRALGNLNEAANRFGDWGMSESNYYWRKTVYEARKLWYSDPTDHHQSIIRLGEVYLNYAEILLLQDRLAEAILAINKTRQTHGGLPALTVAGSIDVWAAYKNERRVDLMLENDRYWALLRWAKFNNQVDIPELTEPIRAIKITADGKSFSFANVTLNNNSIRTFNKRRFLFPVPNAQRQANPNLSQNADW